MLYVNAIDVQNVFLWLSDESDLLEQMPLVMRTAIAVDINLSTFQKIDLFKVSLVYS